MLFAPSSQDLQFCQLTKQRGSLLLRSLETMGVMISRLLFLKRLVISTTSFLKKKREAAAESSPENEMQQRESWEIKANPPADTELLESHVALAVKIVVAVQE